MKSRLVITGLLSLGVLLAGCDNPAPRSAAQKSAKMETPEKKMADLIERAERGDTRAQADLGVMYDLGDGVSKDVAKAVEWYGKAAAQGDARAQNNLGTKYQFGDGVPKNVARAIELYRNAAAQGYAEAYSYLGTMYRFGDDGVPKDVAKAVELYQKAAAQGYAEAYVDLSMMYLTGDGVPKDTARGIEWSQKGAALGNARAQTVLGSMYRRGEEVPKDVAKAIELYKKAAAQGETIAQTHLGGMYSEGEGVPKDAAKAVEWYQKAAAQGDELAQRLLGWMYYRGKGVPEDYVLAYAWHNLAASGRIWSGTSRDHFEHGMSAAEIAEAQRLSSAWKKGQILIREGRSASAGAAPSITPGSLSKKGTATLFVISATGQAITNHHVVTECSELRVDGRDGLAKVVTDDKVNDLALVQIPGEAKASAAITAEPGKLRQGEDIVVFGFPLNAVLSSGGNLTPGVVSALTGLGNNTNQIQITAPIQPGSSGSPVLNKKGEVVGVVSMKLSDSKMAKATGSVGQNVNFAVNGQTLRTFLDTHKVAYRSGAGFFSRDKSTADLADEARKWTLVVECWK